MSTIATDIQSPGTRTKAFGVISIILGLFAFSAPAVSGLSVIVTVGFLVMGGGILRMLWAFGAGAFGRGPVGLAIGTLTLLCGIVLVTNPLIASGFLTVLITICLFVDGVGEIAASFALGLGSGRGFLLIGGIVSIALGLMIWRQFPLGGVWAIGILLGVKLLFIGVTMLTVESVRRREA